LTARRRLGVLVAATTTAFRSGGGGQKAATNPTGNLAWAAAEATPKANVGLDGDLELPDAEADLDP
jgi:hypothetical protein